MGDNNRTTAFILAERIAQTTSGFIQSENHRDLLDIIDTLRSHGVSHYVELPQIIVCGSQSCGKSSTLESLSGIEFPTAEGLCTRFATELILRRGDEPNINVSIRAGPGRSELDRERLEAFSAKTVDQNNFPKIIEAAKGAMGLTGDGAKIFSTDVLRIESTSPSAPNLTLVDLPGLFGASDKNQSDDDATLVQELVMGYMKQRRSIILAVITADNPFANQPVTKYTREIDPHGKRTLGLITKPDKLDSGSDGERYYVDLAQNRNVKLHLGWHVLRNRSHATSDDTTEERDAREEEFFQDSIWGQCLEPSQLGITTLRERLRQILWLQIKEGLPGVKSDVQAGIKDSSNRLARLGSARITARQKHSYLQHKSSELAKLVRAAIDGSYTGRFFDSLPDQPDALERRLRANVQLILTEYTQEMRRDGHTLDIVEEGQESARESPSDSMDRVEYLEVVSELMIESRGRELPGTFNPLVVGDLFSRQCKPWVKITEKLVERIHEAATSTFSKMISSIVDENTQARLMKHHIQPALHQLRQALIAKVTELLTPHLEVHPITYNDDLVENVQRMQQERHNRKVAAIAKEQCGQAMDTLKKSNHAQFSGLNVSNIVAKLEDGTLVNVKDYSASLAADVAAAYYTVALKKFIDDVSVDAIEACLIQRLPDVFSPDVVWDFSEEMVELLGSEDDSTVKERAFETKKLDSLEKGLKDLDAFSVRHGTEAME